MINIIITSTISASKQFKKKHHYSPLRLGELIHNITYISMIINELKLNHKFRILVVDSSVDKDYLKEIFEVINSLNKKNITIRYLYFDSPIEKSFYSKGLGWSESNLINYAYQKYPYENFLKISGRYIYKNIDKLLLDIINSDMPICTHNIYRKLTYSPIVYFPYFIWEEFILSSSFAKMNDKNNFYLEHSIYSFLINKPTRAFRKLPKLIETSRSGSTNISYQKDLIQIFKNNIFPFFLNRHNKFIRKLFYY